MSFNSLDFGKKWQFQNDIQYRSFNYGSDLEQLMQRGGIGYNITDKNNNILQGYAFIRSGEIGTKNQSDEDLLYELRFYQHFITNQLFGRFYITHRYRLEERFLQEQFKVRFRYFLNIKFTFSESELQNRTLYAALYNEIFINGQENIFDRNRLYGALGFAFTPSTRVEIGAMSQIYQDTFRPQLQIGIFKTFDLRRNKD
jgi:hypothetical protein